MAEKQIRLVLRGGIVITTKLKQEDIDDLEGRFDNFLRGEADDDAPKRVINLGEAGMVDLHEIAAFFSGEDLKRIGVRLGERA